MPAAVSPSTPVAGQQVADARRTTLSASDFWQLLLKQLQMQDPFNTGDTQAMLQQFVSLQVAQTATEVADGLQRLQALLLLGRSVQAVVNGQLQTGMVVGVALAGDGPTLSVRVGEGTVTVPLNSVSGVWIANADGGDERWA
ncbi:hypothetical protein HRbin17_01517 [bacterium HR17]|uniref:Basal-body rod modification protein FlgD n=1 Tax=Candidatus Fervidibacter japonicus TaxID=2035412 RepID=A0A2H5XCU7_9BACT|nr:hypothetical protein HRbin17_01517 [bacterium HR17]